MTEPLPYDMGNAGDLIKHGVLAEFTAWWFAANEGLFQFVDPFGGRPWVAPPSPVVLERLHTLRRLCSLALCQAQPRLPDKYFGSAHVVQNLAYAMGRRARVKVSDRDPSAVKALLASGLQPLRARGFDPADGYSALEATTKADLILLDPFDDFLSDPVLSVLPQVARTRSTAATLLFVMDPGSARSERYARLKARYLPNAWSVRCPALPGTGVRGEAKYSVEVLLSSGRHLAGADAQALWRRLEALGRCLGQVLNVRIVLRGSVRQISRP